MAVLGGVQMHEVTGTALYGDVTYVQQMKVPPTEIPTAVPSYFWKLVCVVGYKKRRQGARRLRYRPEVGSAVVYLAWNLNHGNVPYEKLTLKQFREHPIVSDYLFGTSGAKPAAEVLSAIGGESIAGCDVESAPLAELGYIDDSWGGMPGNHRRQFRPQAISELRRTDRWEPFADDSGLPVSVRRSWGKNTVKRITTTRKRRKNTTDSTAASSRCPIFLSSPRGMLGIHAECSTWDAFCSHLANPLQSPRRITQMPLAAETCAVHCQMLTCGHQNWRTPPRTRLPTWRSRSRVRLRPFWSTIATVNTAFSPTSPRTKYPCRLWSVNEDWITRVSSSATMAVTQTRRTSRAIRRQLHPPPTPSLGGTGAETPVSSGGAALAPSTPPMSSTNAASLLPPIPIEPQSLVVLPGPDANAPASTIPGIEVHTAVDEGRKSSGDMGALGITLPAAGPLCLTESSHPTPGASETAKETRPSSKPVQSSPSAVLPALHSIGACQLHTDELNSDQTPAPVTHIGKQAARFYFRDDFYKKPYRVAFYTQKEQKFYALTYELELPESFLKVHHPDFQAALKRREADRIAKIEAEVALLAQKRADMQQVDRIIDLNPAFKALNKNIILGILRREMAKKQAEKPRSNDRPVNGNSEPFEAATSTTDTNQAAVERAPGPRPSAEPAKNKNELLRDALDEEKSKAARHSRNAFTSLRARRRKFGGGVKWEVDTADGYLDESNDPEILKVLDQLLGAAASRGNGLNASVPGGDIHHARVDGTAHGTAPSGEGPGEERRGGGQGNENADASPARDVAEPLRVSSAPPSEPRSKRRTKVRTHSNDEDVPANFGPGQQRTRARSRSPHRTIPNSLADWKGAERHRDTSRKTQESGAKPPISNPKNPFGDLSSPDFPGRPDTTGNPRKRATPAFANGIVPYAGRGPYPWPSPYAYSVPIYQPEYPYEMHPYTPYAAADPFRGFGFVNGVNPHGYPLTNPYGNIGTEKFVDVQSGKIPANPWQQPWPHWPEATYGPAYLPPSSSNSALPGVAVGHKTAGHRGLPNGPLPLPRLPRRPSFLDDAF